MTIDLPNRDLDAEAEDALALQLHFVHEVRSLCFGLMSASPERPCDDASGLDAPLRELEGDATDFLIDQRIRSDV